MATGMTQPLPPRGSAPAQDWEQELGFQCPVPENDERRRRRRWRIPVSSARTDPQVLRGINRSAGGGTSSNDKPILWQQIRRRRHQTKWSRRRQDGRGWNRALQDRRGYQSALVSRRKQYLKDWGHDQTKLEILFRIRNRHALIISQHRNV